MNLYEIDQEIMNCVDMETGEIIDPARLDELQMDRDTKIENIACWIKNLNADAEAFNTEKQSFADRQKAAENKAESLKKYLANYLAGQKFSTPKVTISFRKTSSVNVTDISQLPEEFLKFADPTPDKTAIKNAIKAGTTVTGAEIVEGQSISIK
nr:MAG TPA: resistance protein [Caudoviricetes sp.]